MSELSDYFYNGPVYTLASGRKIKLQKIDQTLTYSFVLEGIPYGPHFQQAVNLHLKWAKESYPDRKIIVLKPRLRPLDVSTPELEKLRNLWLRANELKEQLSSTKEPLFNDVFNSQWPEPVSIGSVCCRALFESGPIPKKEEGMLSELFVIWFQDGFAFPVDPEVVKQIESIDWDTEAVNTDL